MSATLYPGVQFYAEVISADRPLGLCRTPSTYGHGSKLELAPRHNDLYVICADGSVQSVWEPDRPIGWEVFESETGWSYCVTQVGFEPQPCLVRYHSRTEAIPSGGGSDARPVPLETLPDGEVESLGMAFSRHAAIYESAEEGEPEVSSPECPGAPRKAARNAAFGSAIDIARTLGDPDQVEALDKFLQGELSYAEMRMRCG